MTLVAPIIRDVCGTYAGYQRHTHATPFERPCEACKAANNAYARALRARKAKVRHPFPVEIPRTMACGDGLGLAIARAFRESS